MSVTQNKAYYSNLGKLMREDVEDYLAVAITDTERRHCFSTSKRRLFKQVVIVRLKDWKELVGQKYAPYMEFGTGGLVDVPSGLEDYAIQFKGQGIKTRSIYRQPFFISSMEKETV